MTSADGARAEAAAVARRSYGRLVAFLAARTRDVAGAEDALSEAFAAALADWPRSGLPNNPEAWLIAVARRKTIDAARRRRISGLAADHLRLLADERTGTDPPPMHDDRLALMFACAHPAIDPGIRAPLILQTILGLDAATIAAAFLAAPAAMAQRLVRAKTRIRNAGIPFAVPEASDLPPRLEAVLDAIYAAFAKGWADLAVPIAEDAIWLGRLVVSLLPGEAEALGLLALMLHAEARRPARRSREGSYVPLAEQDPAAWTHAQIDEAEALLRRAAALGALGRYQLEAAIQSVHAARRHGGQTDWPAILLLYDGLATLTDSPVVAVNRAVALAETAGAAAGLDALAALAEDVRLTGYQPFWAARADLLGRTGRRVEAAGAYDRAIELESDPAIRRFLQARRD